MTNLFDIAPLLVGGHFRTELARERTGLYGAVVDAVCGDVGSYDYAGEQPKPVTTLSLATASNDPNGLHDAVMDSVATVNREHLCVLDLTGSGALRGVGQTEAAAALDAVYAEGARRMLVLVDSYPPEQSSLAVLVATHKDDLIVVSTEGRSSLRQGDRDERVFQAVQSLVLPPLERLRGKLVRAPGWYRRAFGDEVAYARNWYDGSFAEVEITELLRADLERGTDAVVTTPDVSDWLEGPLRAVVTDLEVPLWTVEEVVAKAPVLADRLGRPIVVTLATSIIHTGSTASRTHQQLAAIQQVSAVRVVAILSTGGRLPYDGRRQLDDGADADYLLRVPQELVNDTDEGCHPRTRGTPESIYDRTARQLSVYEFWDLIHICGARDEENVPPYRVSAGGVPDVQKMLSDFGPWLAMRVMNLAKRETRVTPSEMVCVLPAEPNSQLLGESLQSLFDVPVLYVPRRPWLAAVASDINPEQLAKDIVEAADQEPWITQLRMADGATVIVLDEFTRSGSTLVQLQTVVHAAGLRANLGLVLIDMRPLGSAASLGGLRIRGLYELPYASD